MTASTPGEPASGAPAEPASGAAASAEPASTAAPSPSGFGLFRFSIEGRRTPGLFVAGWLATLVGAGLTTIGLVASPGLAMAIVLLAGLALLTVGLVLLGGSQAVERQAAGEPYGGPSPVLLFAATVTATLVVAALVGVVLELLGVSLGPSQRALGDLLSVALQAVVFLGMVRLMVVGPGALTWAEMGFTRDRRRILDGLASGVVLALPVIAVTAVVASIVVGLVGELPPPPLPATGTGSGFGLHLLAGAAIAPLAEETVFRGAALTAWLRSVGPTAAITRSAILFAAAHVLPIGGGSFGQAAGLALVAAAARLPVAIVLGWLYVRTRTIWAPIGLHATFNAILIALGELGAGH